MSETDAERVARAVDDGDALGLRENVADTVELRDIAADFEDEADDVSRADGVLAVDTVIPIAEGVAVVVVVTPPPAPIDGELLELRVEDSDTRASTVTVLDDVDDEQGEEKTEALPEADSELALGDSTPLGETLIDRLITDDTEGDPEIVGEALIERVRTGDADVDDVRVSVDDELELELADEFDEKDGDKLSRELFEVVAETRVDALIEADDDTLGMCVPLRTELFVAVDSTEVLAEKIVPSAE